MGALRKWDLWQQRLAVLPDWRKLQMVIFWGVLIVASATILLSAHYSAKMANQLADGVDQILALRQLDKPLVRPLVVVDGRDIIVRGRIEPGLLSNREVNAISALPGIRHFINVLEEDHKPSPELTLEKVEGQLLLRGQLAGADLEQVIASIKQTQGGTTLIDRARIDDRLARPLWLDGIAHSLNALAALPAFTLYGWRDTLLVEGVAHNQEQLDAVEYTLPTQLNPEVYIELQLYQQPAPDASHISLLSGWNGAALSGVVGDESTREKLETGFEKLLDRSDAAATASRLQVDRALEPNPALAAMGALLPVFDRVHDLRLQSSGQGIVLWGRVDSSRQLGRVMLAIQQSGLAPVINNQIFIDPAARSPTLSIFRDKQRAVVTGRLPAEATRKALLSAMREALGIEQIEDLINIEPNVAYSPWLERWPMLFPLMPTSVFGLTLSEQGVVVTGEVDTIDDNDAVDRALASMFPGTPLTNWLTIKPDS